MCGPSLADVRLSPGPVRDCEDRNTRYLLSLGLDRLLHTFRIQAGIPSFAEPSGGWASPGCGLRGHFAVRRLGPDRLEFRTALADGSTVPLVPVNQVTDEVFGVYFTLGTPEGTSG